MVSSFPQPENKTFDWTAEVMKHLAVHDTLGCATGCDHIRVLQWQYGVATVALAIDKFNYEKGQK